MRLLFATPPGTGLLYPLVPLAQAALATGHDVLVATTGTTVGAAARSGLHAVDVASGRDVEETYRGLGDAVADPTKPAELLVEEVFGMFGEISAEMLDGVVDAARDWRADAVVYPPTLPAGLVTARALGATAVLHQIGISGATLTPIRSGLPEAARRHGIGELPRLPDIEVGVVPPSLTEDSAPESLPMRYGSYQGGAELPGWLLESAGTTRVTVTLGSMHSTMGEGRLLGELISGMHDLDAELELVVTTGGGETSALPRPLPRNVRLVDWLPLNALLLRSAAVVHHGGAGTTFAALAAGVPQLVLPTGGDRSMNAALVQRAGAGAAMDAGQASAAAVSGLVHRLLDDPTYRTVCGAVAGEMAAMPPPLSVVARIVERITDPAFAPQ